MKWLEIVRFELVYQLRRKSTWFIFALFLLPLVGVTNDALMDAGNREILFHAPILVAEGSVFMSLIALLVLAGVAGDAATRDVRTRLEPLMHAAPVGRGTYLGGRFVGAFALAAILLAVVPLVRMLLPLFHADLGTETLGPFRPAAYLQSYFLLILPNAFVATALMFALATLARHTLGSYVGAALVFAAAQGIYGYVGEILGRWDLAKLLDSTGIVALDVMARTWSPVELNERLIGSEGALLWNRLLWLATALAVLVLMYTRFQFGANAGAVRWWHRGCLHAARLGRGDAAGAGPRSLADVAIARSAPVAVPHAPRDLGAAGRVRQTLAIARDSLREVATPWSWLVLPLLVLLITGNVGQLNTMGAGTPILPTTGLVLEGLDVPFDDAPPPMILLIILSPILLAGELVWRERDANIPGAGRHCAGAGLGAVRRQAAGPVARVRRLPWAADAGGHGEPGRARLVRFRFRALLPYPVRAPTGGRAGVRALRAVSARAGGPEARRTPARAAARGSAHFAAARNRAPAADPRLGAELAPLTHQRLRAVPCAGALVRAVLGRALRLVEYPAAGGSLHATAATIWYRELFSLFDMARDPRRIDLPFAVVAHEVAHQFQPASASVEGRALLSESFAWYAAMGVIEQEYGAEHLARFLGFMRASYLTPRSRADVPLLRAGDFFLAYRKGPFAMYALREYVGQERVDLAWRRLRAQHASGEPPFATSLDLYRELQEVTPDSLRTVLGDLLERNTFWELETRQATAQPTPSGEWEVSLDVVARKVMVDTAGAETDVPMDDLVEIGVFAPAEDGESPGTPLYLEMHRLRSGPQTITVTVPGRPARAGIDPRHLLIDVASRDNLVDIPDPSPSSVTMHQSGREINGSRKQ